MTLRDDVKTLRNALGVDWEAPQSALDRIEQALDVFRPSIMEQFEDLEVGKSFRTGSGSTFVKVGEKAVVRSYVVFEGLKSEYYDNVYAIDQYAHWKNYDDEIETI